MMLVPACARARAVLLAAAVLAIAASMIAGCNIVTPAAYLLGGVPKVPAAYELPVEKDVERKFIVFVDDSNSVIPTSSRSVRLAIADTVTGELIDRKLVPADMMINPRDSMGVMARQDSHTDPMSVVGLGRAVGADIVIYVEVTSFSLTRDRVTLQPVATCNLRVTDATGNLRLFPEDDGTGTTVWPVEARLDLRGMDPSLARSRTGQVQLNEALALELGSKITKVFYEHDSQEIGDRLDAR